MLLTIPSNMEKLELSSWHLRGIVAPLLLGNDKLPTEEHAEESGESSNYRETQCRTVGPMAAAVTISYLCTISRQSPLARLVRSTRAVAIQTSRRYLAPRVMGSERLGI